MPTSPGRDVAVIRRRIAVLHDEARPALTFPLLAHDVFLPPVMVSDNRPPRMQITLTHVEDIAPAKADETEAV